MFDFITPETLERLFPKTMAMAYLQKKAEEKVSGLSKPILTHIIKVLYYKDDVNFDKHCSDINEWLDSISGIKLKPKNKRLSPSKYYEWLFDEPVDGISTLDGILNRLNRDYNSLPKLRSKEDIMNKLYPLYTQLSIDLSNDTFFSIKDYLGDNK